MKPSRSGLEKVPLFCFFLLEAIIKQLRSCLEIKTAWRIVKPVDLQRCNPPLLENEGTMTNRPDVRISWPGLLGMDDLIRSSVCPVARRPQGPTRQPRTTRPPTVNKKPGRGGVGCAYIMTVRSVDGGRAAKAIRSVHVESETTGWWASRRTDLLSASYICVGLRPVT
jgi:hypothetical protein